MQKRWMRWIGHELRHKATTAISYSKSDLAIRDTAFELHFARSTFLAAVTNRVRHTFRKCEQDIMLKIFRHVRIFELTASPVMDLLQFIECTRYEKMLHDDYSLADELCF